MQHRKRGKMKTCPVCHTSFSDEELFCKNCGTKLPEPVSAKKAKRLSGKTIFLSVFLIAVLGITFYFYSQMDYYQSRASYYNSQYYKEQKTRIEKETALEKANKELKEAQEELEMVRGELELAQQNSGLGQEQVPLESGTAEQELSALLTKLKSSYGFASRDYYAEQGVIVLSKSAGSKSVGIICNLDTTVSFITSDNGISCEWGTFNDNRGPISIKPVSKGYHTISFTNKKNNDSFKILVIVTD